MLSSLAWSKKGLINLLDVTSSQPGLKMGKLGTPPELGAIKCSGFRRWVTSKVAIKTQQGEMGKEKRASDCQVEVVATSGFL